MFWPNWPPSGVQVVMVKDSATDCNAVLSPIVVASGYFGYVDYQQTTMMAHQHTTELPPQQEHSRQPQ
jgi:hypothetical protein